MGYFEEVETLKTFAVKYCELTKLMNRPDVNELQT